MGKSKSIGQIKHLSIAHWNINGLKRKLNNPDFINTINDCDICILTETWLTKKVDIDNFHVYDFIKATKISNRKGRFSGGIYILVKQKIRQQIKSAEINRNYGIWFKIDKNTMKLDKHLYIGGIYLPPFDSDYSIKEPFTNMEKDVSELLVTGNVLLFGDFNTRTGQLRDYILKYKADDSIDLDCDIDITEPKARYNSDWETNKYGKLLTNLCKNMDFVIMNGRTEGDIHGRYIYHNPKKGASVVDYGVASASIMSTIKYFHVQTPGVMSDHSLIEAGIDIPWHAQSVSNAPELKPLNESYNWSTSSAENYIQFLKSDLLSQKINHVLQINMNRMSMVLMLYPWMSLLSTK